MHSTLITLAIVAAVVLIHFSYVDFRFRHRDGIMWYWLLHPAPPLMWISRALVLAAIGVAISVKWIGTSQTIAFVLIGLMVLHIACLILLEVLEPR